MELIGRVESEAPKLRFFCFPHAGGTGAAFREWHKTCQEDIELCFIQLPGRGGKVMERPYTSMSVVVDDLSEAILPLLDLPFAFFGHSMGALLAFEVAHRLRKMKSVEPVHLFVSGRPAPSRSLCDAPRHDLPGSSFVAELRRLGGTPSDILNNSELLELILPAIRADFQLVESYRYLERSPLACPITAMGGSEDPTTTIAELLEWERETTGKYSVVQFPGDHFFIYQSDWLPEQNMFSVLRDWVKMAQ